MVLKPIALLSKHSNELVNSIIKRIKDGVSCVELEDNGMIDDECMVEIIDEAREYGATVRDFRLRLGITTSPACRRVQGLESWTT